MAKHKDKCSNCDSTKSKEFWEYADGTILCDECENEISDQWEKRVKSELKEKGEFEKLSKEIKKEKKFSKKDEVAELNKYAKFKKIFQMILNFFAAIFIIMMIGWFSFPTMPILNMLIGTIILILPFGIIPYFLINVIFKKLELGKDKMSRRIIDIIGLTGFFMILLLAVFWGSVFLKG